MDTSEQYIKMCEKATEIQESHEWKSLDWRSLSNHTHRYRGIFFPPYGIWLPTQSQLQEMVEYEFKVILAKFHCWVFYEAPLSAPDFVHRKIAESHSYTSSFESMEQLWLAFVMHEKYQKVWNGEEWSDNAK